MTSSRNNRLISFAVAMVGAVAAGTGLASVEPRPDSALLTLANRFDVSFQDGRTSSLLGWREHVAVGRDGIPVTGDPDEPGPVACCYSADNPPTPEAMQAVEDLIHAGYQGRYILNGSWGVPNAPHTLTWSFAPDGMSIPGGVGEATANNILFSRMDSLFGGNRALWVAQFQACFDRWSALSGLTYVRVRDVAGDDWDDGAAWGTAGGTNRGDIRISMHNIDGVNGILAYCQFPTSGDMVIDSSENWNTGGNFLFLRNVVLHEHGHGIGFAHVCPANQTKLMEPFVSGAYDGPQQDDIRAVSVQYGDNYEPNNSSSTAYDLGTLASGPALTLGNVPAPAVANAATLCISNASDNDYFKLNLADPRLVDFTVTAVGSNYAMYPQDSNCNNTAPNDNALSMANLNVTVYNTNGTTVLRTQDVNPAGSGETISALLLASGNNYVKVAGTGFTEAQLYRLAITVRGTNLAPNASDGTFTDHVHISWPAISDASSYQVYRNTNDATFGGTTVATLTPPIVSFDDSLATHGQLYYYFVKVQQPGNTGYRFTTDNGNTGYIDIPPAANAGPDQTVIDADSNGSQGVTLDGSGSTHSGPGSIAIYRWNEGATLLSQSASPTAAVTLGVGVHTITLTVIDSNNFNGTDNVVITVAPPGPDCDSADFNCDGDVGTDADIEAFFACIAGNCPGAPCTSSADFNHDGDIGTDADIESFFRVLGGGPC